MSEVPDETETPIIQQTDFEQITKLVSTEFQIEVALLHLGIPTYYLKQPQETKQAFLKILKKLEPINMIAILRKHEHIRALIVLKVIPKPPVKPSNILVNWILFFATIVTTFITGYFLSLRIVELAGSVLNPLIGGATFTAAIMAVLFSHEMGHKLSANKKNVEATHPYFIPGPPPIFGLFGIGTFGAVILQKSLPPNRDSLFDIGSSGPIVGFVTSAIVTALGLTLSIPIPTSEGLGMPPQTLLLILLYGVLSHFQLMPQSPRGGILFVHPVALAGWVGMLVTMFNLLPVTMLDGGHVARSIGSEEIRSVLTFLAILLLIFKGFWPMTIFVLYLSMHGHPGPLDDVSSLSMGRKLFTMVLIAIFILSSPL